MITKCSRCGQPVLPDDTVCWQCGAQLLPVAKPTEGAREEASAEVVLPPVSLAMVGYLLAATAVTLLLLLGMMHALAQRPLLQRNVREPFLRGWTAVTASDFQYTFKLPPHWQWTDKEQAAYFDEQLRSLAAAGILNALPPALADPQLLAFSPDDEPLILLVVQDTTAITPDMLVTAVGEEPDIESVIQRQNFRGHEEVVYYQDLSVNQAAWLCRVQVHFNKQPPLRIAVCGPAAQMETMASQITYTLDSFYPLSP